MNSRTKIDIPDGEGGVLFTDELLELNQLLASAQQGLDLRDPQNTAVYSDRFGAILEAKYGIKVSQTLAWLIGDLVTRKLRELQESFFKGL